MLQHTRCCRVCRAAITQTLRVYSDYWVRQWSSDGYEFFTPERSGAHFIFGLEALALSIRTALSTKSVMSPARNAEQAELSFDPASHGCALALPQ
jgi:hypothetical protein